MTAVSSFKADMKLEDPRFLDIVPEPWWGGPTAVMTTVFPSVIFQQQVNSVSTRHIQPDGHGAFDFVWTHFGFADDTPEMTQRRLRQANLFGPAGFVSADDGEVIEFSQHGFEQKPFHRTLAELGGRDVADADHMVTETLIRGMYRYWREVMEALRRCGHAAIDFATYHALVAALRRVRLRRRLGRLGSLARLLRRRLPLPPRAAREPRARAAARDALVREQGHAEGSRLRHPRDALPRSVLPAPRRRRAAGSRRQPGRIESEANYAVFRTKLDGPSTVFNVGRYLDVVVATADGLKFEPRPSSSTAR